MNPVDVYANLIFFTSVLSFLMSIDNYPDFSKVEYVSLLSSSYCIVATVLFGMRKRVGFYLVKAIICIMFLGIPLGTAYAMYLFPKLEDLKSKFYGSSQVDSGVS